MESSNSPPRTSLSSAQAALLRQAAGNDSSSHSIIEQYQQQQMVLNQLTRIRPQANTYIGLNQQHQQPQQQNLNSNQSSNLHAGRILNSNISQSRILSNNNESAAELQQQRIYQRIRNRRQASPSTEIQEQMNQPQNLIYPEDNHQFLQPQSSLLSNLNDHRNQRNREIQNLNNNDENRSRSPLNAANILQRVAALNQNHEQYQQISDIRMTINDITSNLGILSPQNQSSHQHRRDIVSISTQVTSQEQTTAQQSQDTSIMDSNQMNLEEIFKCFICFGKVANAVMCPHCSKLCCRDCIKKWLNEQRQSCPHCRSALRVNQLVACRFVEEVTAAIDTLQSTKTQIQKSKQEICPEHDTALNYYCNTCKKPICSDCAMFGDEHKQHQFEKISAVYERHVELIRKEANGLRKRLKELSLYMVEVQNTIEKVTKAKEEKVKEVELFVENIHAKLNQQQKSKLLTLLQQKGSMAEEIEQLEEFHKKLNKELCSQAQSQLIAKSHDLVKQLREIHNKPTSKFVANSIQIDFPSELVPNYDSSIFIIKDFSRIRHSHEVVYSDPFLANGLTWRLKVYPNGNGIAKGNYISIFLEMLKGLIEPSKYEYRVEMISSKEPTQQIVREFQSDFEVGECWGYNRFYRIDLLEREGFLSDDDQITLKYYVRAPNFAQKSRDQKKYIETLELQQKSMQTQLNEMNSKYNEAVNKNIKKSNKHKKHGHQEKSSSKKKSSKTKSAKENKKHEIDQNELIQQIESDQKKLNQQVEEELKSYEIKQELENKQKQEKLSIIAQQVSKEPNIFEQDCNKQNKQVKQNATNMIMNADQDFSSDQEYDQDEDDYELDNQSEDQEELKDDELTTQQQQRFTNMERDDDLQVIEVQDQVETRKSNEGQNTKDRKSHLEKKLTWSPKQYSVSSNDEEEQDDDDANFEDDQQDQYLLDTDNHQQRFEYDHQHHHEDLDVDDDEDEDDDDEAGDLLHQQNYVNDNDGLYDQDGGSDDDDEEDEEDTTTAYRTSANIVSNTDQNTILREILNMQNPRVSPKDNQQINAKTSSNLLDDYRNYLSGDSDSDEELDLQTLERLRKVNKYNKLVEDEDNDIYPNADDQDQDDNENQSSADHDIIPSQSAVSGVNIPHQKPRYSSSVLQQSKNEEEKENNSSILQGSTIQQFKKDFFERSKQLKHAMTGLQLQQNQQQKLVNLSNNNSSQERLSGRESAIVSSKEMVLRNLHKSNTFQQNNNQD